MADQSKPDTRSQIEVESKEGGFVKILVVGKTEESTLKLFKKVRKEIGDNK